MKKEQWKPKSYSRYRHPTSTTTHLTLLLLSRSLHSPQPHISLSLPLSLSHSSWFLSSHWPFKELFGFSNISHHLASIMAVLVYFVLFLAMTGHSSKPLITVFSLGFSLFDYISGNCLTPSDGNFHGAKSLCLLRFSWADPLPWWVFFC